MDPELDIFQVTRAYLESELSLDKLQEWLVPRLGVFLADLDSTSSQLAGLLELAFADVATGEADEEEVRVLLKEFLREHETIRLASRTQTGSANEVITIGPFFAGPSPSPQFNRFEPAGI